MAVSLLAPRCGRLVGLACGVAWLLATAAVAADVPPARAADVAAIRTAARAYIEALERGDAQALASFWTADGDIVDAGGSVFLGREAAALEKPAGGEPGPRPSIRIAETSLRFISDDVAVEDGTVEIAPPAGPPLEGRFTAVWLRSGDGWKLAALREARGDEPEGVESLADLEWMVGDWVVVDDHAAAGAHAPIEVSTRWDEGHAFLVREVTIHTGGDDPLRITQRIGWDPLTRTIHSWVFGSDGSHGEATWTRDGGSWVAQSRSVMPDGRQTTSLNIYTYDGKDRCAWRSVPTHVGGEHVPRVDMTMIRKPEAAGR